MFTSPSSHSDLDPEVLIGLTAYDSTGDKIGKIGQIFLDDHTRAPAWLTVRTGLMGAKENLAPIPGISWRDDGVALPYTRKQVKDAPTLDRDTDHLGVDEETSLREYYSATFQPHKDSPLPSEDFIARHDLGTDYDPSLAPPSTGFATVSPTPRAEPLPNTTPVPTPAQPSPRPSPRSLPTQDSAREETQLLSPEELPSASPDGPQHYVVTEVVTQTLTITREITVQGPTSSGPLSPIPPAFSKEEYQATSHTTLEGAPPLPDPAFVST